jgi:soluble P-type ATPase
MKVKIKLIIPCDNRNDMMPEVEKFINELHEADKDIYIVKSFSALASRARNDGIFGQHVDLKKPENLLEYDIYAFLDSDVCPKVDDYLKALYNTKKDEFLTGLYQIRGGKNYACGFVRGTKLLTIAKDRIHEYEYVDWTGGGLLIVGSEVLKKLSNPFFHEGVISWSDRDGVERSEIIGEDVVFSFKAVEAGFKIKIVHYLVADHIIWG